jgi:thioredoxin-like negative regulator of GroEL
MAALQLTEDTNTGRLVLRPALLQRVSNLAFSLIWLVGAAAFLVPSLFGTRVDWFAVLAVLLFAVVPMGGSLVNTLMGSSVVFDRNMRTVSSTRSLVFFPISTTTWSFNDLKNIQVEYVSSPRSNQLWLVSATNRDNKQMRINWNGTQTEMTSLAEKISALTGVPVVQSEVAIPPAVRSVLQRIDPSAADQNAQGSPSPSAPAEPQQPQTFWDQMMQQASDQNAPATGSETASAPTYMPASETAPSALPPMESSIPASETPSAERALPWQLPISQLEQRVSADPMDAEARYALARKYAARADLSRAIALYADAIRIEPTNPEMQNDYAIALLSTGKRAEAESAFRRAIALDPFSSNAHLNLALLLRGQNRATEASQEFFLARQNARTEAETRAAETASTGAKMDPRLSRMR